MPRTLVEIVEIDIERTLYVIVCTSDNLHAPPNVMMVLSCDVK